MGINVYWISILFFVVCFAQQAKLQDQGQGEDQGKERVVCPPLSVKSLRVICETPTENSSCSSPEVKHEARVQWKKNVLKNGVLSGDLVCSPSGNWKRLSAKQAPPSGYVKVTGIGYYKLLMRQSTWIQAKARCHEDGAQLLVIETAEELETIKQLIKVKDEAGTVIKGVFLGVKLEGDDFKTIRGSAFPPQDVIAWGSNEPNKGNEDAVFLGVPDYDAHDVPSQGHATHVVCEISMR